MTSPVQPLSYANALSFLGQTVLLEQRWEAEPESFWNCMHVVGVVLPIAGVCQHGYFLVVDAWHPQPYPNEAYFTDIRTIRVIRHRDRHGSGNVLGRIARPTPDGSRAALPARRNGFIVAPNGSTGAAHP